MSKRMVLQEKFINENITTEEYWEQIKKLPKGHIWDSKEWKENRKLKLKECCEKCGSKEKLTIQHTWHPRNYKEAQVVVMSEMLGKDTSTERFYDDRDVCPHCDKTAIGFRKTTNDWKCYNKKCYQESEPIKIGNLNMYRTKRYDTIFSKPNKKLIESVRFKTNYNILKKQFKSSFKLITQRIWNSETGRVDVIPSNKNDSEIKKKWEQLARQSTITMIEGTNRYIEMRDSDHITACGKCAFGMDKELIRLKSMSYMEQRKRRIM